MKKELHWISGYALIDKEKVHDCFDELARTVDGTRFPNGIDDRSLIENGDSLSFTEITNLVMRDIYRTIWFYYLNWGFVNEEEFAALIMNERDIRPQKEPESSDYTILFDVNDNKNNKAALKFLEILQKHAYDMDWEKTIKYTDL